MTTYRTYALATVRHKNSHYLKKIDFLSHSVINVVCRKYIITWNRSHTYKLCCGISQYLTYLSLISDLALTFVVTLTSMHLFLFSFFNLSCSSVLWLSGSLSLSQTHYLFLSCLFLYPLLSFFSLTYSSCLPSKAFVQKSLKIQEEVRNRG